MLLGYLITLGTVVSFVLLALMVIIERKELRRLLSTGINRYSALALIAILVFFAVFSLLYVHPVEQLYFDENIYQGIALNILHSGQALWCQYGTGSLTTCFVNQVYHDIVGYDVFIAAAFALFGATAQTAYTLQLLTGLISILAVFLLTAALTDRKEVPVISTLVFATIPELFIWSRTQAAPDMPFMMFTILAAFFFVIFIQKPDAKKLLMFFLSLTLVIYTRTEGLLLVPVFLLLFFVFSNNGTRKTVRERLSLLNRWISDSSVLLAVLIFVLLMLPVAYYAVSELQAPSYGNNSNQALFSFSNFEQNIVPNTNFILGLPGGQYPEVPSANLVPLALIGVLPIAIWGKRNRFGVLLFLVVLFLSYMLFYPFFYAGSVSYGVDVRFILESLPFLAVLAGFGVVGLGLMVAGAADMLRLRPRSVLALRYAAYLLFVIALVIIPFSLYAPSFTLPINQMPQASYPNNATAFFYNNYNAVPTNCLVFSFTPDMWYQYNRSSAQIGYMTGANASLKQSLSSYSCFVLDYGYWCTVPPYENTTCSAAKSEYNLSVLTSQSNGEGSAFAFYKILNYSP